VLGWEVSVDMMSGKVSVRGSEGEERTYWVRPVGRSVQELWVDGGLEGYVKKSIEADA